MGDVCPTCGEEYGDCKCHERAQPKPRPIEERLTALEARVARLEPCLAEGECPSVQALWHAVEALEGQGGPEPAAKKTTTETASASRGPQNVAGSVVTSPQQRDSRPAPAPVPFPAWCGLNRDHPAHQWRTGANNLCQCPGRPAPMPQPASGQQAQPPCSECGHPYDEHYDEGGRCGYNWASGDAAGGVTPVECDCQKYQGQQAQPRSCETCIEGTKGPCGLPCGAPDYPRWCGITPWEKKQLEQPREGVR